VAYIAGWNGTEICRFSIVIVESGNRCEHIQNFAFKTEGKSFPARNLITSPKGGMNMYPTLIRKVVETANKFRA